jgi:WXG100 family type VII secretion target
MVFAVTFSDLVELSSTIGKAEGSVESIKSDIQSSSGKLASHWNSTNAQQTWSQVQTKWNNATDELKHALHGLATTVQSFESSAQHTEAQNARLFEGE